jgi:hypothetical protein
MDSEAKKFEHWALVELMGHQRIVGRCTEETIAGTAMLRVDVPTKDGNGVEFTRFYGSAAIYAISPISKELAVRMAAQGGAEPVKRYELEAFAQAVEEEEEHPL